MGASAFALVGTWSSLLDIEHFLVLFQLLHLHQPLVVFVMFVFIEAELDGAITSCCAYVFWRMCRIQSSISSCSASSELEVVDRSTAHEVILKLPAKLNLVKLELLSAKVILVSGVSCIRIVVLLEEVSVEFTQALCHENICD